MKYSLIIVPLSLLLWWSGAAGADQLVTLDTRPGIKQSVLLIEPPGEVKGVILMFPGHEGVVRFVKTGDGYEVEHEGGGLTVRKKTFEAYRRNGLVAAVVALPTGREGGIDTRFRSSVEHSTDIRSVIAFLSQKYGHKPVLHGHCRGTFSPASITTRLENGGIGGLIMSSPRSQGRHGAVMDYQSGVVSVPVLLVQHTEDPCPGTPYRNLGLVKQFYERSSHKVDVILVTGGDTSLKRIGGSECQVGAHSFAGLEEETANAIAAWVLGRDFPRKISK